MYKDTIIGMYVCPDCGREVKSGDTCIHFHLEHLTEYIEQSKRAIIVDKTPTVNPLTGGGLLVAQNQRQGTIFLNEGYGKHGSSPEN